MQGMRRRVGVFFLLVMLFGFGARGTEAAPIKILNNSNHAYGSIGATINILLGRPYTSSEFTIDFTTLASYSCSGSTNYFAGLDPSAAVATSSSYAYCNSSSATTTPSIPYQIFSTSYTANPGDSLATYNNFVGYDITDDYAFTNSPAPSIKMPPAFYTAPGNDNFASAPGVEWKWNKTVYDGQSLSGDTAANTGFMAWLRLNHPTWNWFDVKAAVRQTAANWATGYNSANYGFGLISTTTSNALTDNQILLQPTEVATSTSGIANQLTFTVLPFRQTRRVKDVLFQFASNPGFQANELTLAQIQALGGTKITEYTGTTATTTTPFNTAVTNAYFVWFTADNSTDSSANFSRIDTYNVLGPLSQNEVSFSSTFDLASPSNNVSTTSSPTFTWNAASSYLGISKYQLFVDGVLNKDNIAGTSATSTGSLSDGVHTWYVKAFNGGGTATSSVSTRTINTVSDYASGYTFYVDNVLGSDTNPGTQALPWATLGKAGNTAQAGNTVIVVKNTNQPYREKLTLSRAGTSGSPITFRGVDANNKPEIWGSDDVSGGWTSYGGGNPNTYQKTLTKQTWIVATGPSIGGLTKRVNGSSKTSLNPGEWVSDSSAPYILYYRLAAGEDISTLHIEADTRDYGISSTGYYITLKNVVVRYANTAGVDLYGTGSVLQGVEVYDSYAGIVAETGAQPTINYCVTAGNDQSGIGGAYGNPKIYNSLMYGNGASGSNIDIWFTGNSATLKNNISSGNTVASFSFNAFWGPAAITASNNAWDIAGDSRWDGFKGTSNQELKDSLFVSTSTRNFTLQQFSPDIDAGTSVGLTTDILGNPIYGTPDIGPYEYQPPYSMTSGGVPIGGSFRIYGNGKYRMLTATSSTAKANLTVTPVGGFPSSDYSQWLDVAVSSWTTSTPYAKSWTETGGNASSVAHTVGDLAAHTVYDVTVDGAAYTTATTNAGGTLSFTYTGSYATSRTFSLSAAPGSISVPSGGSGIPNPLPRAAKVVAPVVQTAPSQPASSTPSVQPSLHAGSGLSKTQVQSILSVLISFGVDHATVTNVEAILKGPALSTSSAPSCSFARDLMIGMWGKDVACLQQSLITSGYTIPSGATSHFGAETRAAVTAWQKAKGIVPSRGYFGVRSRGEWER